jgi:predicted GNAT family acetyltransferase
VSEQDDAQVVNDREASRYEVFVGDELAGLAAYRLEPGRMVVTHTEVDPAFQGRGLAGRLARAALEDARVQGLRVAPACEYMETYLSRHPEYADLTED